ncbi:MAG: aminoglycoside phosphotransferase family protein, partial [Ilumatobacteraceae bacterium]
MDRSIDAVGVAQCFDLGVPDGPAELAGRGQQGIVWRLVTGRGRFAIKELRIGQTEAEAAADVAYQEAILSTGFVRMPRPLRTRDGTVLAVLDGYQLRAYEWVDLLPPDVDLDPTLVGATVGAIHHVDHDNSRPLDRWYTDPVGADRWDAIVAGLRATSCPFTELLAQDQATLVGLEALMVPPTDLRNCHRDLFADNVLPTAAGGICVIDWENCGLEDPSHELAVVLYEFGAGRPERLRALYAAYAEAGGGGRLRNRSDFTMLIAQFGHFVESAARVWLDAFSTEGQRESADARFRECHDSPLTVDAIDEILDSVSGEADADRVDGRPSTTIHGFGD